MPSVAVVEALALLCSLSHRGDGRGRGFEWRRDLGSGEETDIWSAEGGRWIIGLVFRWSVGGQFRGAQCPDDPFYL
jgi:hypothetical protein